MTDLSSDDPIVNEIRKVREEHAARFGYDLRRIFDDVQAQEKASGRQYVRYPGRTEKGPQCSEPQTGRQ